MRTLMSRGLLIITVLLYLLLKQEPICTWKTTATANTQTKQNRTPHDPGPHHLAGNHSNEFVCCSLTPPTLCSQGSPKVLPLWLSDQWACIYRKCCLTFNSTAVDERRENLVFNNVHFGQTPDARKWEFMKLKGHACLQWCFRKSGWRKSKGFLKQRL